MGRMPLRLLNPTFFRSCWLHPASELDAYRKPPPTGGGNDRTLPAETIIPLGTAGFAITFEGNDDRHGPLPQPCVRSGTWRGAGLWPSRSDPRSEVRPRQRRVDGAHAQRPRDRHASHRQGHGLQQVRQRVDDALHGEMHGLADRRVTDHPPRAHLHRSVRGAVHPERAQQADARTVHPSGRRAHLSTSLRAHDPQGLPPAGRRCGASTSRRRGHEPLPHGQLRPARRRGHPACGAVPGWHRGATQHAAVLGAGSAQPPPPVMTGQALPLGAEMGFSPATPVRSMLQTQVAVKRLSREEIGLVPGQRRWSAQGRRLLIQGRFARFIPWINGARHQRRRSGAGRHRAACGSGAGMGCEHGYVIDSPGQRDVVPNGALSLRARPGAKVIDRRGCGPGHRLFGDGAKLWAGVRGL